MHPRSPGRPTQQQLIFPTLQSATAATGPARPKELAAALAERFALPAGIRSQTRTVAGRSANLWERHVRFAILKAREMGYLASAGYGRWQVTDEGREGIRRARRAVVLLVHAAEDGEVREVEIAASSVLLPSVHSLRVGDARDLSWLPDGAVHLYVVSPPYHDRIQYESVPGQLGDLEDYDHFLEELDPVWDECYRTLSPGGRLACVVGDVLRSRAEDGRHHLLPLHADLLVRMRRIGFDALTGILWHKIASVRGGMGAGRILGPLDQPGGIVRSEIEHILLLRKPGKPERPTREQRELSRITAEERRRWFRPIWTIPGARRKEHPAPFPPEIPYRLSRMFTFSGQTVGDVFAGEMNTAIGALRAGRNSVACEVAPTHFQQGLRKLELEARRLPRAA